MGIGDWGFGGWGGGVVGGGRGPQTPTHPTQTQKKKLGIFLNR